MMPTPSRAPAHQFTIDDITKLTTRLQRLAAELPPAQAAMLDLLIVRAAAAPIERAALAGGATDVPALLSHGHADDHDRGAGVTDPAPFVALALGVAGLAMIGPKQDDPGRRGGAVMIGPKQDDPAGGRGLAMIGPKQDDPIKLGIRHVALDTDAGLDALAGRDPRWSGLLAGDRPLWLVRGR